MTVAAKQFKIARRVVEDEMRLIVEDIQRAADDRVADLEASIDGRIEDAVAEATEWVKSGKGDSLYRVEAYRGSSIFEQYVGINDGDQLSVKDPDRKKFARLSEAEWTAVGFVPNQDPNTVQDVGRLRLQQAASRYQYINYPIAHSEIENLKRYVLGRGIRIDCLVDDIKHVVQNFWERNNMEIRVKQMFQTYLLDGEYFPLLFDNYDPGFDAEYDTLLNFRSVSSSEIDEIELDPEDYETRLSYKRMYVPLDSKEMSTKIYLDISHPYGDEDQLHLPQTLNRARSKNVGDAEQPERVRMMMFRHGLEYDLRGRVIMESILRWNRVAVDFLYSRARLNHLRSKIFLVETRGGGSGKRASFTRSTEPMPEGGMKLIETPDRKYQILAPNTGAVEAETDYKSILYMIGSALSMPIHILQVNAENENYASIKEAGNPYAQMVQDMQDEYGEHLRRMLRYLIVMGIRRGVLKEEYTVEYLPEDAIGEVRRYIDDRMASGATLNEAVADVQPLVDQSKKKKTIRTINIPLMLIFPNIIQTDPTQEAQAVQIYITLGLMSVYTARLRIGLNPEVEESRTAAEWAADQSRKEQAYSRFNNGLPSADPNAPPAGQPADQPAGQPTPPGK